MIGMEGNRRDWNRMSKVGRDGGQKWGGGG
jgi:hypothetical protein